MNQHVLIPPGSAQPEFHALCCGLGTPGGMVTETALGSPPTYQRQVAGDMSLRDARAELRDSLLLAKKNLPLPLLTASRFLLVFCYQIRYQVYGRTWIILVTPTSPRSVSKCQTAAPAALYKTAPNTPAPRPTPLPLSRFIFFHCSRSPFDIPSVLLIFFPGE